jgi:HIV Tat-specific factor 1
MENTNQETEENEEEYDLDEDFVLDSIDDDDNIDGDRPDLAYGAKKGRDSESESESQDGPTKAATTEKGTGEPEVKRKRKRNKKKKPNCSVYVQGLPLDVTMEEMIEFFKKAGVIAKDPYDLTPKVRIYTDTLGQPKGDGLVTYLKPLAVISAFDILNEADFRPPKKFIIKLQLPQFENTKEKGDWKNKGKKPLTKKKKFDQEQEDLGWEEKEQVHVIIKHMFDPKDPDTIRPDFYDNLKNEIKGELDKMGPVASIKVFERNPEGVVAVKYQTGLAATRCINIMGGRFFDGRKLEASYYDGHSNYKTEETKEERKRRDEAWSRWLEGNDEYEERKREEKEAKLEGIKNGEKFDSSTDSDHYSSEESDSV